MAFGILAAPEIEQRLASAKFFYVAEIKSSGDPVIIDGPYSSKAEADKELSRYPRQTWLRVVELKVFN